MMKQTLVIKVGGNELSSPAYIAELADVVAALQETNDCILVHGGGKSVSGLMARLGIEPAFIDGQRVTDEPTLEITEMVLSGQVNKTLVLALLRAGLDALGLSGIDRGLLQVEPWSAQMDRVGRIVAVKGSVLQDLCAQGVVPVISPISYGPAGKYNVNADHAAGAIAGAIAAGRLVFVTNVPGVHIDDAPAASLSAHEIQKHIGTGAIFAGMIPKVQAAQAAAALSGRNVTITNLTGLRNGTGTTILAENGDNK